MKKHTTQTIILAIILSLAAVSCTSVYYNTFYNARKAFNKAEKARTGSKRGTVDQGSYGTAIEKSLKVVEDHPNSKYYDDALYVLGVSYFWTKQYARAERRFREILANYENSEYKNESTVYLAKAKLELGDIEDAMEVFGEIFSADFDRDFRAEAAMALGRYYATEEQEEQAISYFMAVRDSLGDDAQKLEAQVQIADEHFSAFRFGDALGAYLQVLGMDPDKDDKYTALYQAAVCSFRLQQIEVGLGYLNDLMADELYFDSLGSLGLMVAEGYEYDGDLELAEEAYAQVAETAEKKPIKAKAYYRLGLIYQYDYDMLPEAKEYYDLSLEANRGGETGRDALQHSTDIGKLDTYAEAIQIDSTGGQDAIDDAAYHQYLLAELYWFQLNKPDSAIRELQYIVDSLPEAYDAPNAMIALSQMYREYLADTAKADSMLGQMLQRYPRSDYLPVALEQLELLGTEADTGYAAFYIHQGENFLFDDEQPDSARFYYQYVVDSFPDSRYHLQAQFNLIWMTEMYDNPGDSTVYYAYKDFIDSFPASPQADQARERITPKKTRRKPAPKPEEDENEPQLVGDDSRKDTEDVDQRTGTYADYEQSLYIRPNGDTIILLDLEPIETVEVFEFPSEAYGMTEDAVFIYFHILLDFSGKVTDVVPKSQTQYEEVNVQAKRTVASMTFDPLEVSTLVATLQLPEDPDGRGYWFVLKYLIEKPDFLR